MKHPFPSVLPLYKTAFDFVLPPRCTMCRCRIGEHGHLCAGCWTALTPIAAPRCVCCALPFAFSQENGKICANCMTRQPVYDRAYAAVLYDGKGRDLVLALKHGGMFSAVPVMARMMVQQLLANGASRSPYDLVMPVPLHWTRLIKRRFNQSQLLSRRIGSALGVPVAPHMLKRGRATPSQGTLGRKKRFENVRSAFVVPNAVQGMVKDRNILLVDDVLTTGATVSACAKALKAAGARNVDVVVFARVGDPVAA